MTNQISSGRPKIHFSEEAKKEASRQSGMRTYWKKQGLTKEMKNDERTEIRNLKKSNLTHIRVVRSEIKRTFLKAYQTLSEEKLRELEAYILNMD